MKSTKHKSSNEAIAYLKSEFPGLQIKLQEIGQHGEEYLWEASTPFARPAYASQYAGTIFFNHNSKNERVWNVTGSKV